MTSEYRRTQVPAADPRQREPVLYVYPDGVFTKSQKRRRIDMIFHGWDHLKKDPPKEQTASQKRFGDLMETLSAWAYKTIGPRGFSDALLFRK